MENYSMYNLNNKVVKWTIKKSDVPLEWRTIVFTYVKPYSSWDVASINKDKLQVHRINAKILTRTNNERLISQGGMFDPEYEGTEILEVMSKEEFFTKYTKVSLNFMKHKDLYDKIIEWVPIKPAHIPRTNKCLSHKLALNLSIIKSFIILIKKYSTWKIFCYNGPEQRWEKDENSDMLLGISGTGRVGDGYVSELIETGYIVNVWTKEEFNEKIFPDIMLDIM
jgi:hypothetical protein